MDAIKRKQVMTELVANMREQADTLEFDIQNSVPAAYTDKELLEGLIANLVVSHWITFRALLEMQLPTTKVGNTMSRGITDFLTQLAGKDI